MRKWKIYIDGYTWGETSDIIKTEMDIELNVLDYNRDYFLRMCEDETETTNVYKWKYEV